MRICNCTLPYTNPKACENCPNNIDYDRSQNWDGYWYEYWEDPIKTPIKYVPTYAPNKVKRTTKTIEKYDSDGKYLGKEVIIIEEDDNGNVNPPYDITCGETGETGFASSGLHGGTYTFGDNDLGLYFTATENVSFN